MEEKVIVRYYRKGYRVPRGCVVGIVKEGVFKVGHSLYNKRLEKEAGLSFTKKRAVQIAKGRAMKRNYGTTFEYLFPESLIKTGTLVMEQCKKMITPKEEEV